MSCNNQSKESDLFDYGKLALKNGDLKSAEERFFRSGRIYAVAYCKFLSENYIEAKKMLESERNNNPHAQWIYFLCELCMGKYTKTTYFKVKNFYEQDLDMLIFYNRQKTVQKITDEMQYLERFNREVYKYCARVMLNNGYYDIAERMADISLDILYKDPETHFIKGEIALLKGNKQTAAKEFRISSEVCGVYKPALKKLDLITG